MKLKTRLAALALTVLTPLGAVVAESAPASAASSLTFCFKWSTGAAYASQPVNLRSWNGSSWVVERNGRTNTAGCATFLNVPTSKYTTVNAYTVLANGQIWSGWSPLYANPGNGGVNIGTGYVYRVV
jgi:hypothetical protein